MADNKSTKTIVTKTTTVETITTEVIDSTQTHLATAPPATAPPATAPPATAPPATAPPATAQSDKASLVNAWQAKSCCDPNGWGTVSFKDFVQTNTTWNTTSSLKHNGWGKADPTTPSQTSTHWVANVVADIRAKEQPKPKIDRTAPDYKDKMLEQVRLLNTLITHCKEHIPKNIVAGAIKASNHNAELSYRCEFTLNDIVYDICSGYESTSINISLTKDSPMYDIIAKLNYDYIASLRLTKLNPEQQASISTVADKYKRVEEYHVPDTWFNNNDRTKYCPYLDKSYKYGTFESFVVHICSEAEALERQKHYQKLYPKTMTTYAVHAFNNITQFRLKANGNRYGDFVLASSYPILFLYLDRLEPIPETILDRKSVTYNITDMRIQQATDYKKNTRVIAVPVYTYKVE